MIENSLKRFLEAQEPIYSQVVQELRAGAKRSHWMWFIFPQMRALGHSSMAHRYGIGSLDEAAAYVAHPTLGSRLRECCRLLLAAPSNDANAILGYPDDLKLKSSMTLFARAAPEDPLFVQVLSKFFQGEEDPLTLELTGSNRAV